MMKIVTWLDKHQDAVNWFLAGFLAFPTLLNLFNAQWVMFLVDALVLALLGYEIRKRSK